MKTYFIGEHGMQLHERVTAKNFHVRYTDGYCKSWQVVIRGSIQSGLFRTNSDYCGLWYNDKQIASTEDIKFSHSTNYRMKQIRTLMIKLYCVYGE